MLTKFQRAQTYTVYSRPGLVLEDVLSFDFWAHVAHQLKLNDLVAVVALDGTFDVTMRVIGLGNSSIEFRILNEWRPAIDEAEAEAVELTNHHLAVVSNRTSGLRPTA